MHSFRITKYNPLNRDKNGYYKKDEWTSVSDVGQEYSDEIVTFESYILYENAYIDAVLRIMSQNNVDYFEVQRLQIKFYKDYPDFIEPESKDFFNSLANKMLLSNNDITKIIRFNLREIIWCKLVNSQMYVHFGYDYYMYIGCKSISESVINAIETDGLFVETFISPYIQASE